MEKIPASLTIRSALFKLLLFLILILGFIFISRYNYLLFHTGIELISIIIAVCVFIITLNSYQYFNNESIRLIGLGYLFVAILDLFHTLGYPGMTIFASGHDYGTQLWVSARYLEGGILVVGFSIARKKQKLPLFGTIFFLTLLTTGALLSIFYFHIFPTCLVPGIGLTPFKIISEYLVCGLFLLSLLLLIKSKELYTPKIFKILVVSIIISIFSELSFTLYVDPYGLANKLGHLFKLISFLFIYFSIIETGFKNPLQLVFFELNQKKRALEKEVVEHIEAEKLLVQTNQQLQNALDNIQILHGLLPVCSWCKKIRDDEGYWHELETYLEKHSPVEFTHGICPNCRKERELDT